MKIGFSTSVIQGGKTGVAQYVFALLRAMLMLPAAGEHRFVLFVLENDLPLFQFAANRMQIVPVNERWRPAVRNIAWHQTHLPRLARKLNLDVLHIPSYRRMLWRSPCPNVATIHDLAPFHVRGKYDWKRMLYGRIVVKHLARRQHAIIAVSQNTANDLQAHFDLGQGRVTVIHNGIDHTRFSPADRPQSQSQPALGGSRWNLGSPFFLYVSRLEHPGKNHVRLIKAFEQFKLATGSDWLLALAGSDWHGADEIHRAAAASSLSRDIRFLGFVADAELPALYRATQVLVYPSLFEGFGFPPLEAMACACPVIASDRGALREILADAAVIIDPEDPATIAAAMTIMSGSAEKREHWRRKGLARARLFNWDTTATRTLEIYEQSFLHRKNRHSPPR